VSFPEFLEKIESRHLILLVGLLVLAKIGCKRAFPPPDIAPFVHLYDTTDEDKWVSTQKPLAHSDYYYTETYDDNDTTVLYRQSRYVHFTTRNSMDFFELTVRGKRLLTAKANFRIRQPNGSIIYSVDGPAIKVLCPQYFTDLIDQENAVRSEIEHFFDHANFLFPALNQDEPYDPRMHPIAHADFEALYLDDQINGFMYNSFAQHETRVKIYYSRQAHRVKIYYRCCDVSNVQPVKQ
jgi:hypothetical protein